VSLIEGFWAESTPYHRRLFLDEANGRTSGGVTFEFDMFDVTLDFDEAVATVADALGDEQSETAPLEDFLQRAASFGDDPSFGDGLTEMQRRPPRYAVDRAGTVRPASDETAP
jgi:hypothetical protein